MDLNELSSAHVKPCGRAKHVSIHLKAAEAVGIRWHDIAEWDESRIEQALYPDTTAQPGRTQYPAPNFGVIQQELRTNKHVTLHLLWQEYRQANPNGYRYS